MIEFNRDTPTIGVSLFALKPSTPGLLEVNFGSLQRLNQTSFNEGRSHAMVVSRKMPARSCIDQVLKERYLLVVGHVYLFLKQQAVRRVAKPTICDFGYDHRYVS